MKIIVKQMQKVQSVIKVTIICLSILYVNLIQGQETIKGKYGYFGHYTGYNQDKKDQNIFIFIKPHFGNMITNFNWFCFVIL